MTRIGQYRRFNRVVKNVIIVVVASLWMLDVIIFKWWLSLVIIGILVVTDYLYNGDMTWSNQYGNRIILTTEDKTEQLCGAFIRLGFRRVDGEHIHFVQRSRYGNYRIATLEERDGRLIVDCPRKYAEPLYNVLNGIETAPA